MKQLKLKIVTPERLILEEDVDQESPAISGMWSGRTVSSPPVVGKVTWSTSSSKIRRSGVTIFSFSCFDIVSVFPKS